MNLTDEVVDNVSVDYFARLMKAKLAKKRDEGRGGWHLSHVSSDDLSKMLREHVEKGDPIDVANLAMMIYMKGDTISKPKMTWLQIWAMLMGFAIFGFFGGVFIGKILAMLFL